VTVDIGEFEKLEGCVTCLSVLVPAAALEQAGGAGQAVRVNSTNAASAS
jgi:hypothetical protein